MHAYAACDDDDVRRVTQTSFGKLWLAVAEITGLEDDDLIAFFGPRDAAQHGCGHGSHGCH